LPGISEFIAVKQTVAVFHGSLAGDAQSRWAVVLCVCVCVCVCTRIPPCHCFCFLGHWPIRSQSVYVL